MIINGNSIAESIIESCKKILAEYDISAVLSVFVVGDEYATEKYIIFKKKMAEAAGIQVDIHKYPLEVTTTELIADIKKSASDKKIQGIIVQLPLPQSIDAKAVLESIPVEKDIDVLSPQSIEKCRSGELDLLPPVVGALSEICNQEQIEIEKKNAVVIGSGPLVGQPAAVWLKRQGAQVTIVDKNTNNFKVILQDADIIVSGAGMPNLITPDMIKQGVVLFDAGTSEASGKLSGDADPRCAEKCSVFTPVPGGLGPITTAVLLRNMTERMKNS